MKTAFKANKELFGEMICVVVNTLSVGWGVGDSRGGVGGMGCVGQ